jgi:hypothetical protein
MVKSYLARTIMVVRAIEKKTDLFMPKEEGEKVLKPEYPYLSDIGLLIYLANNTRHDIASALNYLVRYSVASTMRHRNDIKNIL